MFNLTHEERRVILFLLVIILMGTVTNFFSKKYSQAKIISSFYKNIGKVELNNADRLELMSVSGIGAKLSQRIIDYRKEHNGFNELEELKNIKGITEHKYTQLKEALFIDK